MRDLNMLNFMYSFHMLSFTYSEGYFFLDVIHVVLLGLIRMFTCRNHYVERFSEGNFQVIFNIMIHFKCMIYMTRSFRLYEE